MSVKEYLKRYIWLFIGLFIMSLGIALSTRADLGTSPISCVPYVLSLGLPLSMGVITIIMHCVFVVIQIILLKKDFNPIQLLQVPVAFVFGFFTDLSLLILSPVSINAYHFKWLFAIISAFIVAFGVNIEVKANVLTLAGEGLVLAISKVTNKDFGKCKTAFDCSLMLTGALISLVMFHSFIGVREGSVAAAILVGTFVRILNKTVPFIYEWVGLTEPSKPVAHEK